MKTALFLVAVIAAVANADSVAQLSDDGLVVDVTDTAGTVLGSLETELVGGTRKKRFLLGIGNILKSTTSDATKVVKEAVGGVADTAESAVIGATKIVVATVDDVSNLVDETVKAAVDGGLNTVVTVKASLENIKIIVEQLVNKLKEVLEENVNVDAIKELLQTLLEFVKDLLPRKWKNFEEFNTEISTKLDDLYKALDLDIDSVIWTQLKEKICDIISSAITEIMELDDTVSTNDTEAEASAESSSNSDADSSVDLTVDSSADDSTTANESTDTDTDTTSE